MINETLNALTKPQLIELALSALDIIGAPIDLALAILIDSDLSAVDISTALSQYHESATRGQYSDCLQTILDSTGGAADYARVATASLEQAGTGTAGVVAVATLATKTGILALDTETL